MLSPVQIHDLLYSQGSLTARLEHIAKRPLRVKVAYEGYRTLSLANKKQLGLPVHKPCIGWVREVALYGTDDTAWVKAVSVFALPSLTGQGKRLKHLGTTPIGYVLFARQRRLPHTRTIDLDRQSRSTVYEWQGRKILISERFL